MAALPVVLAVSAGYGAGFTLDDRQLSLISAGGIGNNNGNGNADDNNGNNGSGDNQGNGSGNFDVPKLNLHFLMNPQNSSD